MKTSLFSKIVVVFLVGILANSPLYAVCTPEGCGGFTPCSQLLQDTGFDESSCHSYWSQSGSVSIVDNVADAYGRLYGTGWITQLVDVPDGYDDHEVFVTLDVVAGSGTTGTERVYVEIVQSNGVVLETLAVYTPTSADGPYSYFIDDYGTFYVGLRFRYSAGSNSQGTEFRIKHTNWWEYN